MNIVLQCIVKNWGEKAVYCVFILSTVILKDLDFVGPCLTRSY